MKQMKIIHGDGFTEAELKSYKPIICDNLIHSMRAVLEAMGALQINLADQVRSAHGREKKRESRGQWVDGRKGGSCLGVRLPQVCAFPLALADVHERSMVEGHCLLSFMFTTERVLSLSSSQNNRVHVKAVLSYVQLGTQGGLTPELTAAIKALWVDSGVQVRSRGSRWHTLKLKLWQCRKGEEEGAGGQDGILTKISLAASIRHTPAPVPLASFTLA